MATKLTAPVEKKLLALGISAKTEEVAKSKLNEILVAQGIEGMEDEELETLIDLAESFIDDVPEANEEGSEENVGETEEELEQLAEEDEVPAKKPASKPVAAKPVAKPAVSQKKKVVEEEDEDEVPAKKPAAKPTVAAKPAAKPATKPTAKPVAAAKTKAVKLNPKDDEDAREHFDFLKEIFSEDEYIYAWISNAGVTVKYKGKNSNRAVLSLENSRVTSEGVFTATLYLPTFNGKAEKLDENDVNYEICWSGVPFVKDLSIEDLSEVLTALLSEIETSVNKFDKKLGENRQKMEENLKKPAAAAKPAAKPTAKPVAQTAKKKVVEEEDEDEVPAKKTATKPAAVPSKKK